jgi:hypothetical protein
MKNNERRALAVRLLLVASLPFFALSNAHAEPLSLTGRTWLPQLANADVTVWVGAQSVSDSADADGRFAVDLDIDPGPELIRVQACGIGDQSQVCFVRLVHTAAEILSRAAGSGSYHIGDLSPVSTAGWAALLKPIPNQTLPTTLADMEQFRFGLSSADVLPDAALLSLIARGEAVVPPGAIDLVSILLDPALKSSAQASAASGELSIETDALVQNDSVMLTPGEEFDLLGKTYLVPLSGSSGLIMSRIELNPDQTGNYVRGGGSGSVEWTNVEAGELLFRDDMERVGTGTSYVSLTAAGGDSITPPSTFFVADPDGPGPAVTIEDLLIEVEWRELDASELLRIGVQRTRSETVAPDRPDLGPEDLSALGVSTSRFSVVSRSENDAAPPAPVPTAGSQWAFPRCETDCTTEGRVSGIPSLDLISFNPDGSATAEISDPGLDWQVSNGRIVVNQDNGFVLDVLPFGTTAVRAGGPGDLETTLIVTEVTGPGGEMAVASDFVLEADPGFALTEATVAGIYSVGSLVPGDYILQADGTGWRRLSGSVDPNGPLPTDPTNLTWSISASGDLVVNLTSGITFVATPVRAGQSGFYSVARWSFGFGANPEDNGGSLVFWDRIDD